MQGTIHKKKSLQCTVIDRQPVQTECKPRQSFYSPYFLLSTHWICSRTTDVLYSQQMDVQDDGTCILSDISLKHYVWAVCMLLLKVDSYFFQVDIFKIQSAILKLTFDITTKCFIITYWMVQVLSSRWDELLEVFKTIVFNIRRNIGSHHLLQLPHWDDSKKYP